MSCDVTDIIFDLRVAAGMIFPQKNSFPHTKLSYNYRRISNVVYKLYELLFNVTFMAFLFCNPSSNSF